MSVIKMTGLELSGSYLAASWHKMTPVEIGASYTDMEAHISRMVGPPQMNWHY